MKLLRFGDVGKEKIAVDIAGEKYDVSSFGEDYNEAFFGTNGIERLKIFVDQHFDELKTIPSNARIGVPFARPSKIICVGLNYKDHAKETNSPIPTEPIILLKATSALIGPYDPIVLPKNSTKTDWEVELAVVIGKKASYVDEVNALNYVAGYVLHNDVTEREYQLERGGTWDKGKGCDTFSPMGPFLVTKDEIEDVDNIPLWLKLNGKILQNGNTQNLIFNIPFIVSYVSQFMTLLPGDIISTGTPAGVGLGRNPTIYLKEGDVLELGGTSLGTQRQAVVAFKD